MAACRALRAYRKLIGANAPKELIGEILQRKCTVSQLREREHVGWRKRFDPGRKARSPLCQCVVSAGAIALYLGGVLAALLSGLLYGSLLHSQRLRDPS